MAEPNDTPQSQDGTATLRPRARLMRTLGDELISSEVVAVSELVKNAYDADATRVLIRFVEPLEPGAGAIEIIDDGHGMTLETIRGAFLEPATRYRQRDSRSEEFGRIVTGEKGIGRFAVSRLADELELVSRRPGAPSETRVVFDWRLFDREDAYLDEVDVVWETTPARDIAPGGATDVLWPHGPPSPDRAQRGTLLRMPALRTAWGREQIERLRTSLARLVSPFLFDELAGAEDAFSIFIQAPPTFQDLSGRVEPSEALQNPHYRLTAQVAADGRYTVELLLRGKDDPVRDEGRIVIDERAPTSGPFEVDLRVWDRDAPSMRDLAEQLGTGTQSVRRDLDRVAGINVYRDGFRVLPYGEPGNDWLNLDSRRVQNPTTRISNNQVFGFVRISKDTNPDLRDQTNREGLISNRPYEDLRISLRQIIARLEEGRYAQRRENQPDKPPGRDGLFSGFDLKAVQSYIAERYPTDKALRTLVGETEIAIEHDIERAQEVVVRYRRLATLGQLIDKVLHDGRAPLSKIGDEADIGLQEIAKAQKDCEEVLAAMQEHLEAVIVQHDALATVFRRLEPFGGRKRGRPADIDVEEIVKQSVGVLDSDIKRLGVDVRLPDTQTNVKVDRAELQEVFVNLIDNSLHWLKSKPKGERKIQIDVSRDDDGVRIFYSDSGPGVRDDVRDVIFDPYFSTKEDGTGLGLSIAGEIVHEYYDGDLRLHPESVLGGATFEIVLRHRI
jgi:signal transduction histidine kinase